MQEVFRRRNLPHWDINGGTFFVTCCLAGSISSRGQSASRRLRCNDSAGRFREREQQLDEGRGVRWMDDRRVASAVRDAMLYFAGDRYDVFAYVVMPSHVHWVFRPLPAWNDRRECGGDHRPAREVVVHSFCRHSALICNRLLQRSGPFWQHESYDRVVRNDAELQRIVDYIEFNPVKAGLCGRSEEWEFSSAWAAGTGRLAPKPVPRF
jgi:REP element-mobilizing transposase RayT